MGRELLRQFEFIDFVVSGEADDIFPGLIIALLKGLDVPNGAKLFSRRRSDLPMFGQAEARQPHFVDLNSLPTPDYDEYFLQIGASIGPDVIEPSLLFETSRGCWWGAKHHCTFCGLNGTSMTHRTKTPERAIAELLELSEKYPGLPVNVVDNILDMKYFTSFIPLLAERNVGVSLAYEVKSNLTKKQLHLLKRASIEEIQPGIESFSDMSSRS